MRAFRAALLGLCLLAAAPGHGQISMGEPVSGGVSILTIDLNRLSSESRFGQAMLAGFEAEAQALAAENRDLEAQLEAEETSLAGQRATLPAPEFQKLAEAFDAKVKDIRRERDAKVRDLSLRQEQSRRTFERKVIPVLEQILNETGADMIIDRSLVVARSPRIDITDVAIQRVDAVLMPDVPTADAPAQAAPGAAGGD